MLRARKPDVQVTSPAIAPRARAVGILRRFCRDHRRLAALLVALALCLKMLVPAGYMIGGASRTLTISICADAQGAHLARQIVLPTRGEDGKGGEHGKAAPCPYAALGMASLPGADTALLALALAFILALGFASALSVPLRRAEFLRPPLRGPPAPDGFHPSVGRPVMR